MQEELLQFIWQYSLYRPGTLATTEGDAVQVIHPGTINRDAGPDFSNACIRIGDTTFAGNVEIHVRSSDWGRHGHDADPAYSRLILHVVYDHDAASLPGGIPLLCLRAHIPDGVLQQYSSLIQTTAVLPCAGALHRVSPLVRGSWLDRLLITRWEHKMGLWSKELQGAGGDWHTLLYRRLAENFGFKVNAAPFHMLAQSLPLKILSRQSTLFSIEALLFGQSGLLAGRFEDAYPRQLQEEYAFLRRKYDLTPIEPVLWKFMRLRPANFPTVRIAQFAALIHGSPQIFSAIGGSGLDLQNDLSITASSYWNDHYSWDERQQKGKPKMLGGDAVHNLIINTLAPIRFLYARTHGQVREAEAAIDMLTKIPAEDNNIIRMWSGHGWAPQHAADSQSLIQLYNGYCAGKRCLHCAVGLSLIRSGPDK